ncbi:hypothetical protein ACTXT7_008612, partial [Hymenolepis weldensis]
MFCSLTPKKAHDTSGYNGARHIDEKMATTIRCPQDNRNQLFECKGDHVSLDRCKARFELADKTQNQVLCYGIPIGLRSCGKFEVQLKPHAM